MKSNQVVISIVTCTVLGLGAVLSGCGSSTTTSPSGSVATKTTAAYGTIRSLNPLNVNGKNYTTSNSKIYKIHPQSKQPLALNDLKQGMVVRVSAQQNTAGYDAVEIDYNELTTAPVTALHLNPDGTGTIDIMGQTIHVNKSTKFYGGTAKATINDLAPGDWVEISGFADLNNTIKATMIAYLSIPPQFAEVEGVVTALDTTLQQFKVNGLIVDYATATMIPANAKIADNVSVEIEGTFNQAANMIIAKTIGIGTSGMDNDNINEQKENGSDQESGSENGDKDNVQNEQHGQHGSVNGLDMQGVVQNLNTATSTFTLNGKQVTYTPATVFKGLSGTTLANGLLVEAEGAYDANKSFVATEIKAEGKEAN